MSQTEYQPGDSLDGTETILVVEDEADVRQLVVKSLRLHGYRVLEAAEPKQALTLTAAEAGAIHLLLTDVIMPQMNGRALYEKLAADRAELKVLYMSGYTDDVILHHGVLDKEIPFLQKPFPIQSLLEQIKVVLGR